MGRLKLGSSPIGHVQNIAVLMLNAARGGSVTIAKIARATDEKPAVVRAKLGATWRRKAREGAVTAVPELRSKAPFDMIALHLSTSRTALAPAEALVARCEKRATNLDITADCYRVVVKDLVRA